MSGIGLFVKEFVLNLVAEPVDPPFSPTDPCRGLIVKSEVNALVFDEPPTVDTLGVSFPEFG